MTMPHLMNCSHSDDGWCLDCVKKEHDEVERRSVGQFISAQDLKRAADLANYIAENQCRDEEPSRKSSLLGLADRLRKAAEII